MKHMFAALIIIAMLGMVLITQSSGWEERPRLTKLKGFEHLYDSPEYPFVASKHSDIYHPHQCSYAHRILPENKVYFKTETEAKMSGRRRAWRC